MISLAFVAGLGNGKNIRKCIVNNDDGNLLINAFCASLCSNISETRHLNDIISQTQERLNKKLTNIKYKIYDENYIPSRK